MSNPMMEEKVFKDPVHKYIYVQDRVIWDLINTKEFQRLRRIRQLGTSFYTFHGAEHSRFSHSLGVYETTRKIISQFERRHDSDWPVDQRLICLCAALLHDVGHGPFSHSIEPVFDVNHEDWTCRIIMGDTEINRVLRQVSDSFPEQVAAIIEKRYQPEIAVSLISSQMDADRMDYLLRDAYFTGVHYGTFDLERILRVMRPYQNKIIIKESGMHAVEDYLMARYQMYWQVYFHPVTRSSEIILRKIFRRAKQLHQSGYTFGFMLPSLQQLLGQSLTIEDYLELDESLIQLAFKQWMKEDDPILRDLCMRFLHRRLFKYKILEQIDQAEIEEVEQNLRDSGLDPDYYMEIDFPADLPYDVYRPGQIGDKPPILILNERGQLIEISRKSDIIRSISGVQLGTHHLYYPEEFLYNQ